MTEAVQTEAGKPSAIWSAWRDPAVRIRNADWLAGLIAVMLPWSTTGVGIAAVLWLIALVPTIEPKALWQSLKRIIPPPSNKPIARPALKNRRHSRSLRLHCSNIRQQPRSSANIAKRLSVGHV